MEYHPGGDLYTLLAKHDDMFSEEMARFYLAEMMLGIQALHDFGYIHRDIKVLPVYSLSHLSSLCPA